MLSGSIIARNLRLQNFGALLVMGSLVQGCTAEPTVTRSTVGVAKERTTADIPHGAIEVGEDLYQLPIGPDADGCPMFRIYSPTRLVAQAIYYRDAAGGFTMSKEEAACASGRPH